MPCNKCEVGQVCEKPLMMGTGKKKNPSLVIIKPFPSPYEENPDYISFSTELLELIKQNLGTNIDKTYITNLVKCCPYADPNKKDEKTRALKESEIQNCRVFLESELSNYKDAIIMPIGKEVLNAIFPDNTGVNREAGRLRELKIGNHTYKVLPNYNPRAAKSDPKVATVFKQIIGSAFNLTNLEDRQENWKILNPKEATEKIKEIIQSYKNKEIDYSVFDIETTSLSSWKGDMIMFSVACSLWKEGFAIPLVVSNEVHHDDLSYEVKKIDFTVSQQEACKLKLLIKEFLEIVPTVGHNLKFDYSWCVDKLLIDPTKIKMKDDTINLAYLIYGRLPGVSLSLKELSRKIFGLENNWEYQIEEYLKKFKRVKDRHYGNIPTSVLGKYAALDAYYNRELFNYYDKEMIPSMEHVREIMKKAVIVFTEAETKGLNIDKTMRTFLTTQYEQVIVDLLNKVTNLPTIQQFIHSKLPEAKRKNEKKRKPLSEKALIEGCFKISSTKDLTEIIHGKDYFSIAPMKKFSTPKGAPSINKDAVAHLIKQEAILPETKMFLEFLRDYKIFMKIKTTYIDNLPEIVVEIEGQEIYKPEFNLTRTVTARLSSGFHTLPGKSDVKRMYNSRWANSGGLFLSADESQVELRIAASLSGEKVWLDAFNRGEDIHRATAAKINKKSFESVTKDERGKAKDVNFGTIYGLGPKKLSEDTGMSFPEAQNFLKDFFIIVPDLKVYIEEEHIKVRKNGFVMTDFGRIIPIPEAQSHEKEKVADGERRSVNNRIQSDAADITTGSIVRHYDYLKEQKMKTLLMGCVHDSVQYDTYPGELPKLIKSIKNHFETIPMDLYKDWLKCPLVMDVSIGTSWGSCIDFKVLESSETNVVLEGKGFSKDIRMLNHIASKAYKTELEILEKEPVSQEEEYRVDNFIRDNEKWKVKLSLASLPNN